MNTTTGVLKALEAVGGSVGEEAGRVVYRAPRGALTPAIRAALREHREGILNVIRGGTESATAILDTPLADFQPAPRTRKRTTSLKLHSAAVNCTDPAANTSASTRACEAVPFVRPPGACYTCGGAEFWRSRWVERICCVCHPQLGTPERRESYEERAAILEYFAKLPRPEAERLAKEMSK